MRVRVRPRHACMHEERARGRMRIERTACRCGSKPQHWELRDACMVARGSAGQRSKGIKGKDEGRERMVCLCVCVGGGRVAPSPTGLSLIAGHTGRCQSLLKGHAALIVRRMSRTRSSSPPAAPFMCRCRRRYAQAGRQALGPAPQAGGSSAAYGSASFIFIGLACMHARGGARTTVHVSRR